MTKKLGIITLAEVSGKFYKEQIQFLFDNKVEVQNFSFEKGNVHRIKDFNVVLVSTSYQHELIKDYLSKNTSVVIGKVTLSRDSFDLLRAHHKSMKAMFVNQNHEMCIESISLIYSMGFKNFEFVPVYPDMEEIPKLPVAFTVGEKNLVPDWVEEVVDLGHRILDKNTIVELAYALHLEGILSTRKLKQYFEQALSTDHSVELLLDKSSFLENQIGNLLEIMDKGVIIAAENHIISNINNYVEEKLGIHAEDVIGKHHSDAFPDIDFYEVFKKNKAIPNKLIRINNTLYSCSIYPIMEIEGITKGAITVLEDFRSTEKKQNSLRLQLMNKGHIAKYHIEDIQYNSNEMGKIVEIIRRISHSDASVLIIGESGTGKELIAQSIHNLSKRKEAHFIAINCAALPESILESELFGYMPGTFTGALSNGKIGIFEMANNGTLFLDEIGDLSLNLQSRLLRVLQEREIMRLGGDEVIKVNIRVIAATNSNLIEKIENNLFRKDLFYRLNVLPIKVPALRERVDDIPLLIQHFKDKLNANFELTADAYGIILSYHWDGNIRELENCVEFLKNLNQDIIDVEDLPYYIVDRMQLDLEQHITESDDLTHEAVYVLGLLYRALEENVNLGRRSLFKEACYDDVIKSEYELRNILKTLESNDLIHVGKGREGTRITNKGIVWFKANGRNGM